MKKIVLMVLVAAGVASVSFGYGPSYNHCKIQCEHNYAPRICDSNYHHGHQYTKEANEKYEACMKEIEAEKADCLAGCQQN